MQAALQPVKFWPRMGAECNVIQIIILLINIIFFGHGTTGGHHEPIFVQWILVIPMSNFCMYLGVILYYSLHVWTLEDAEKIPTIEFSSKCKNCCVTPTCFVWLFVEYRTILHKKSFDNTLGMKFIDPCYAYALLVPAKERSFLCWAQNFLFLNWKKFSHEACWEMGLARYKDLCHWPVLNNSQTTAQLLGA